ncbi:hypothetical protein JSY36_16335 [Bacillus sp. H-16]|uniref:hypothetical protein n=1 Tax=Alteribacter salitolerans TaxID=2912333 RepID=UPI001966293A|nr:hypothetical protein [Alteribacter salitolerans]MBM7097302.1 hypothetical protein [Alteribacter salitolerans]
MTPFNESLPYLTSEFILVTELDIIFLVLIGLIFWAVNKTIGFQLFFLLAFSVTISNIIQLFFPGVIIGSTWVPLTHLPVQAVMTFFAFFIPLTRNKLELSASVAPILAFSITFLFFTNASVFSIVGAIIIGGFIVYAFYRSFDWIGSMPDRYVMVFSIILPVFLAAVIYPNTQALLHTGYLLGAGVGISLEFIKVRMSIPSATLRKRLTASAFGLFGIALFKIFAPFFFSWLPLPLFTMGVIIGLWITFIVPLLLVVTKFYKQEGVTQILESR